MSGLSLIHIYLNRVSDNDYWRDFPRSGASLTQRLLPNEMAASGHVGAVAVTAGVYTWQTLQDAAAPIVAPYDRQPQIDVRWGELNQKVGVIDGLDYSLTGQLTRFTTRRVQSVTSTQADIKGNRWLGIAQIGRHWQAPGWFIKPKAQLHVSPVSYTHLDVYKRQAHGQVHGARGLAVAWVVCAHGHGHVAAAHAGDGGGVLATLPLSLIHI